MNKKWIMYILGFGALYLLTKKKSVDNDTNDVSTPDVGNSVNEMSPKQTNVVAPSPIVAAPPVLPNSAPSIVTNVDSPFKY